MSSSQSVNLVIQTAFLGDLILSIPVLKRIKKEFPLHQLAILCKKGLGDFLLKEKIVDIAFEVEKSNKADYENAKNKINELSLDHVFCIHRSIRSLFFAAGLSAKKKIGYSSLLGFWFFDDTVEYVKEYPDVIRQFKILETTDLEVAKILLADDFEALNYKGAIIPEFFSYPKSIANTSSKKIAVFPGSVWATKRWTADGYAQLISLLQSKGYEVELLGGPDEKELCEQIASAVESTTGKVKILAGQLSIAETISRIDQYTLVVTNDSAPAHMAAFKNVPVVAVFGPTTLSLGFRPWSNNSRVVENVDLDCRPCGAHGHMVCPLGHHRCMKLVSAMQVYSAIEQLL